jgi:hypothetical protein
MIIFKAPLFLLHTAPLTVQLPATHISFSTYQKIAEVLYVNVQLKMGHLKLMFGYLLPLLKRRWALPISMGQSPS